MTNLKKFRLIFSRCTSREVAPVRLVKIKLKNFVKLIVVYASNNIP